MSGESLIVIDGSAEIAIWRVGTVDELMDDNDINWAKLGVGEETKIVEFETVATALEESDCYYFREDAILSGGLKGDKVLLATDLWGNERELSFFIDGVQASLI